MRFLSLGLFLCMLSCGGATAPDGYEPDASLTAAVPRCTPGASTACACTDGGVGAQRCLGDGTYDRCECTGTPSTDAGLVDDVATDSGSESPPDAFVDGGPTACALGSTAACDCPDGTLGKKRCRTDGAFDPCECAILDAGVETDAASPVVDATPTDACTPIVETEWCDGRDNDCDGIVDNGEVCPSTSIGPTDPFTRGVYFLGTTAEGSCGSDALQRFWPSLATTFYGGFDCYADWFRFRRSDYALYYLATFSGLRKDVSSGMDPVVATPPCSESSLRAPFDFDGTGILHYACSGAIRRGAGEIVTTLYKSFVGTLDDGRVIATRASETVKDREDYVVLGKDGAELSRLAPHSFFVGKLTPDPLSASIAGNKAYVMFIRDVSSTSKEFVTFRFDGSAWSKVRRASTAGLSSGIGNARLVISDGTIFVDERDPLTTFDYRIRALRTDGTWSTVWREADAKLVRKHIGDQLLVGPP